jgi:hypothetical protein
MDPETGLQLRFVRADFTAAFARGQVDGFQWGLARHPADLIHPKAPPKVPELWQPWPTKGGSLALSGSALELDLIWVPGMLAWNIRERGFPGRRNWRPVPAWVRPIRVALGDDAFWVDTDKGALGLDLETGAIRRVAPVLAQREATTELPQEDGEATWQAYEQRWQAEEDAARPGRLEAAAKGNPEAMLALGWATNDATEAAGWFRKAAELGNAQGMFELAVRLYQGRSVSENREEAKAWFQKAAKAGHPSAAEVLKGLFDAP